MLNTLRLLIDNKRIVLLGFGLEGQSSFRFIKAHFPKQKILIADQNPAVASDALLRSAEAEISSGTDYLKAIRENDFVIKSPGIKLPESCKLKSHEIYSQTDLFIRAFRKQIIGITGTKGKSTTSTLCLKILQDQNKKVVLLGNIGKPAFDYWDSIDKETLIVFELSAHQLEFVRYSPAYAILLNLFPEHLDYFVTPEKYFAAKLNIARFQKPDDSFFISPSQELIQTLTSLNKNAPETTYQIQGESVINLVTNKIALKTSDLKHLKGEHQLQNISPLLELVNVLQLSEQKAIESIQNFQPLAHRLEFIAKRKKVSFYNDSISTIPEATIVALKALKKVDYLILGGLDRTIDYTKLYRFLIDFPLKKIFFIGPAGKRMYEEMNNSNPFQKKYIETLHALPMYLPELLSETHETVCLLSPAAASYDEFKNFEARGDYFRELIQNFA